MKPTDVSDPQYYHRVVDCQWACPAHTDVPEYIRLIAQGRYTESYLLNRASNVFPGILGRTCDRPCEPACRRGRIEAKPVAICRLKRVASDHKGDLTGQLPTAPEEKNGKRIALIGCGPASLTVANDLAPLGYELTIFDKLGETGGLMRTNIPKFRLPPHVLDEEIDVILDMGVDLRLGHEIPSLATFLDEHDYDAVFIGSGAPKGKDLDIPGRQEAEPFIEIGITWLESVAFGHVTEIEDKVLIIGVGNTAMDCCRTSKRLGATDIKVMGRRGRKHFKASPWELEDAEEELIEIVEDHSPKEFVLEDGKLKGMTFVAHEWMVGEDGKERQQPVGEVFLPADRVILAIGQEAAFPWVERDIGIEFDEWDMLRVDKTTFMTTRPGVFVGGDAAWGPENIIWAVEHGHQAAISIHQYCQALPITERPPVGSNLISQKMGLAQWSYSNYYDFGLRTKMQHVDLSTRFESLDIEVEMGFDLEQTLKEAERCLNCDIQTHFTDQLCIECDACVDICPVHCLIITPNAEEAELRLTVPAPAVNLDQPLFASGELPQTQRIMVKDEDLCIHCGLCAERCPTAAWDMRKFDLLQPYAGRPVEPHEGVDTRMSGNSRTERAEAPEEEPPERVNDFAFKVATVNGTGSASANGLILKAIYRMGLPVSGKNVFPSNIQGLPTWYEIRVNKNGHVARIPRFDLIVAMNPSTYAQDVAEVESGGWILYDDSWPLAKSLIRPDITYIGLPLARMCVENFAGARERILMKNIAYTGALAALIGMDVEIMQQLLEETFARKKALLDSNHTALALGYDYIRERFEPLPVRLEAIEPDRDYVMMDGNTAAALGCVYAGATVGAWYPITPATSLMDNFRDLCKRFRTEPDGSRRYSILQAEDELAAAGMVIGAGWMGARAFTPTSGPGLDLMSEFIGFAYYTEIPCVFFDIQRAGPSTGMPTRTQQGDLLSVAYASHGDTKHVALFPGSPEECFYLSVQAFDLAERFQTPVFVVSDLDIGMNDWRTPRLHWDDSYRWDRGKVFGEEELAQLKTFSRYLDVDGDGVAARTLPGAGAKGAYFTRGSGHDKYGRYTENEEGYQEIVDRLVVKLETARAALPAPVIEQREGAVAGLVCLGSSEAACSEAIAVLAERGHQVDKMRVRAFPFSDEVDAFLRQHAIVFVADQNRDGQLRALLLSDTNANTTKLHSIRHYSGTPLSADHVLEEVLPVLEPHGAVRRSPHRSSEPPLQALRIMNR